MAKDRLGLQDVLCNIIGIKEPDGDEHVYFNPPENLLIKYPAIIYRKSSIDDRHADNSIYNRNTAYEVIVVDYNVESEISDKVSKLPLCRFNRSYIADNLNHDVYTIYN